MFNSFIKKVREIYTEEGQIPLHKPLFIGNEKKYLLDTIDSVSVSSIGAYVEEFERLVAAYTGAKFAVATVNGTSALHISLLVVGVKKNDEVITQSLSFVATCNAISYCGATPLFVDVDKTTLGMCPVKLNEYLNENTFFNNDGECVNKHTENIIRACLPMHTFGHPVNIEEIKKICDKYNLCLVEDAAEALGSFYDGTHTGRAAKLSAISFNGNKIVTAGGGGIIITDNEDLYIKSKHLTTTAKKKHKWKFKHDQVGYNYRLPNLNAALGCAQMEKLPEFVSSKRLIAHEYSDWGNSQDVTFVNEPSGSCSNYWLNALVLKDKNQLDEFLRTTNAKGIMTRPIWEPMHKQSMYNSFQNTDLGNTEWLAERIVNIPSSVCISA